MTRKGRRLTLIGLSLGVLALAGGLVLLALDESIVFFASPSEVMASGSDAGTRMRLGGLVREGSVERGQGTQVRFVVTDNAESVAVVYEGMLPDLFREGQGVVTEGMLGADGVFVADTVLAKHDESYMPREVADSLKEQGHWQPDGEANR